MPRLYRAGPETPASVSAFKIPLPIRLPTALTLRPARGKDGRSHVERLIVVRPPRALWQNARLLASDSEPAAPPENRFGRAPTVIFQRSGGWRGLFSWGDLTSNDARKLYAREAGSTLLFVNQRGAPPDRWCTLDPQSHMPEFRPEALLSARQLGRSRYLIERVAIVENRRRVEAHAERVRQRTGTNGLLERTIRLDRLVAAWRRTHRNKGAPGVDRVSVELFSEKWQERLSSLQSDVRGGHYRPQPYLRVWAEKKAGGTRLMSIPSVVDRVLMGAAADVLSAVLEPHFFDRSFAYRPGRSARTAVSELLASPRISGGVGDHCGYRLVFRHDRSTAGPRNAARACGRRGVPPSRHIVDHESNARIRAGDTARGVPQGAPISPVLANLCLTPLDHWMEARALDYVRYADDFVALCDNEVQARKVTAELEEFLDQELKLSVKPAKTKFVAAGEGFEFLGFAIAHSDVAIPEERLLEAKQTVGQELAGEGTELNLLTQLDSYVRGFRNYFDLGMPGTTRQLQSLEADRVRQLSAWARARRLDLSLVLGRTERFVVESEPAPMPGSYADGQQARAADDAVIPPVAPPQPTSLEPHGATLPPSSAGRSTTPSPGEAPRDRSPTTSHITRGISRSGFRGASRCNP